MFLFTLFHKWKLVYREELRCSNSFLFSLRNPQLSSLFKNPYSSSQITTKKNTFISSSEKKMMNPKMDYKASRICEIVEDDEQIDLPPGFRFHPTDEELITHYLKPKVFNTFFSATAIGEVDLNKVEPWDLPCKFHTLCFKFPVS